MQSWRRVKSCGPQENTTGINRMSHDGSTLARMRAYWNQSLAILGRQGSLHVRTRIEETKSDHEGNAPWKERERERERAGALTELFRK